MLDKADTDYWTTVGNGVRGTEKKIQIQHSIHNRFISFIATRIGCGGGKFATLLSRLLDSSILKFKSNNK